VGPCDAVPGEHRALVEAYARTRLEFLDPATGRERVLHPAPPGVAGPWPFRDASAAAVVTAWHPRSDPGRDPSRNRADLDDLRRTVLSAGHRAIDCIGVGPATDVAPDAFEGVASGASAGSWSEPSLLVPGVDRETACAWAASFEQNAIFWWTPSDWRVVGVLLATPDVVLGWRLSPAD